MGTKNNIPPLPKYMFPCLGGSLFKDPPGALIIRGLNYIEKKFKGFKLIYFQIMEIDQNVIITL